jgi:hypothetical protein
MPHITKLVVEIDRSGSILSLGESVDGNNNFRRYYTLRPCDIQRSLQGQLLSTTAGIISVSGRVTQVKAATSFPTAAA